MQKDNLFLCTMHIFYLDVNVVVPHPACVPIPCSYMLTIISILVFYIRSVPDLYLIKEAYIRGFALSGSNVKSSSEISICSSSNGELIMVQHCYFVLFLFFSMWWEKYFSKFLWPANFTSLQVNGDDEIYFASISVEKEANRYVCCVLDTIHSRANSIASISLCITSVDQWKSYL